MPHHDKSTNEKEKERKMNENWWWNWLNATVKIECTTMIYCPLNSWFIDPTISTEKLKSSKQSSTFIHSTNAVVRLMRWHTFGFAKIQSKKHDFHFDFNWNDSQIQKLHFSNHDCTKKKQWKLSYRVPFAANANAEAKIRKIRAKIHKIQ